MHNYKLVSPSLDGVIRHGSLIYDGIVRPPALARIFDRPAGDDEETDNKRLSLKEQTILEQYFQDLYGIFMKKLSHYIISTERSEEDELKLIAMLQEMIKIKKLL